MAAIPPTIPSPALATLSVGGEDSLKFSFEVASGIGEASVDDSPLESTLVSFVPLVATNGGSASPQILGSAISLLQFLASHIMNLVQGWASSSFIPTEATPPLTVPNLVLPLLI